MRDIEYTPTLDQVRDVYHLGAIDAANGEENLDHDEALAMFDRWLQDVKAEAWNEGLSAGLREANDKARGVVNNPALNPYRRES